MTPNEIKQVITGVEEKYPVDKWVVDGIHVWPLIRIDNYMRLSFEALKSDGENQSSLNFISKILKQVIKDRLAFSRSALSSKIKNQACEVVFMTNGDTNTPLQNGYYDKYCDPIVEKLGSSCTPWTMMRLGYASLEPRLSKSYSIQGDVDWITIKSRIISKFRTTEYDADLPGYDEFLAEEKKIGLLSNIPSKNKLFAMVHKIQKLKRFFERILKETNVSKVFIVAYYNNAGHAMILACRSLNIEIVDLQHGVQGSLHLAYGSWTRVPDSGFDLLPNSFWVWSDYEKKSLACFDNVVSDHESVVSGNTFLEAWIKNGNELPKLYDSIFDELFRTDKQKVLLTLSPGADSEHLMADIWNLIRQTKDEFLWLIRLHPHMMTKLKEYVEKVNGLGIPIDNVVKASELPLYAVLRKIDVHITAQSSVTIESSKFGVPSIITSEYGMSLYVDSVPSDFLTFARSKTEVLNSLKKLAKD